MTKEEFQKVSFHMVGHLSTDKMHYLTYSSEDGLLGYCDRTPRLKHGQLGKTRRHWRIFTISANFADVRKSFRDAPFNNAPAPSVWNSTG